MANHVLVKTSLVEYIKLRALERMRFSLLPNRHTKRVLEQVLVDVSDDIYLKAGVAGENGAWGLLGFTQPIQWADDANLVVSVSTLALAKVHHAKHLKRIERHMEAVCKDIMHLVHGSAGNVFATVYRRTLSEQSKQTEPVSVRAYKLDCPLNVLGVRLVTYTNLKPFKPKPLSLVWSS